MADPRVNVARTVWHGSASFIGNMAEKLLSKVNNLEKKLHQYLAHRPECLEVAKSYIQALKQFDAVVHSCFGQTLTEDYSDLIKEFMATYRSLGISIPLKVTNLYISMFITTIFC